MEGDCELCAGPGRLFEVITEGEIKSVCVLCSRNNNWPIISKSTQEQQRNESRFVSVKKSFPESFGKKKQTSAETQKLDDELREIVLDSIKPGDYFDLIDNFHWHIQSSRRRKKFSQKQLGEAIAEPDVVISMAEKKELPEDYDRLISKLEQFLHITLRRNSKKVTGLSDEGFDIKKANLMEVKTSDLREDSSEDEVEILEEDLEEEV